MRSPITGLLAALALALPRLSPAAADDLSVEVDRYAHPEIRPQASEIRDARVHLGHFEVTLRRGVLAAVTAGSTEAGFFFRGEGFWTYAAESPEELPVVRENARQISRWKATAAGSALVLKDDFRELLWIGPGSPSPGAASRPAPVSAFAHHLVYFSRLKGLTLAQRAVVAARTGSALPVAWGEFLGGRNEALYLFDPVVDRSESLSVVKTAELDSANAKPELVVWPVSQQPIGHSFRHPPPEPVRLSRVEAEIEAQGEHARIATRETFVPVGQPLRLLRLNLLSRVFADSALDIRPERLRHVQDDSGQELPFDHRNGQLLVELPTARPPGEQVTLRFEMEGDVLYHPNRDSFWILGFEPWFPRPELDACAFTWSCRVRVDKPFVPLASGRTLERREELGANLVVAAADAPVSLPVVVAGDYHLGEAVVDGRTIRIASYAYRNPRATRELADLAGRIIAFDEEFLGPFPWPELTIIEMDSYGFGVAPPATVFITQEAFSPHRDEVTRHFSRSVKERLAHEIAHQYWGHQVKWSGEEQEWISESFAAYCAALFLRREQGEATFRSITREWEADSRETGNRATLATANRLLGERASRDRTNLLYGKGPWLLNVLAREVGEPEFRSLLGDLQSDHRWQFGTAETVEEALEKKTGRPFADFFDRYFWGTEIPPAPR